ncbi:sigma-70 family RNA polymerase sigma factor [Clostridium sp. NSJ-145]|uniref:sigma-70 family RNA polymerase sigma factor n=1 Tax=Clostridium sp. NSJ-145 TaxID=2897777 RepID=UPI001E2B09D1|nr:sigma-70 family RNA polymerase sigma factor [Clostridium sp. NSJ-145]
MEEIELIKKAQDGNKHAMNILLQNNYKALYGFTLKMTANEDLTQDIVQEVCLKAVVNINKFKGKSKFQSWLISIAINYYRDIIRRNKKIDYSYEIELSYIENNETNTILDRLQVEEMLKELKKMPYEKRISFILKHYYGYSYEEISKVFKCSEGTVKSRVFYTASRLKKKLVGSEV